MKKRTQLKSGTQYSYLAGFIFLMAGQFANAAPVNQTSTAVTQLSAENIDQNQRKGPDAIGGIGDWLLSNGRLCAVISDTEHEGEFSTKGGSLIDLGFCGRADDHFSFTHDLIDGSRHRPLNAQHVSQSRYNGYASIKVESSGDGATLVTHYYFTPSSATQLHIAKRYERAAGESFSFISPLTFNYHSLEPFVFNSQDTTLNAGFQNRDFVQRGVSAIRDAARNADTIITVSPRSAVHGIAYGWKMISAQRIEGTERYDLPFFMLADADGTAMMLLTDTFYIGSGKKIGWAQMPQIPLLELPRDAAIETHETVYVGKRGDAASVTDQMMANETRVFGTINEADSAIHITQENGAPLTHIVPNSDGQFSFRAPTGSYTLKALAQGKRMVSKKINISEPEHDLGLINMPEAAYLTLPEGEAMRLVFVGLNGTPNPDFSSELTEASVAFDERIEVKKANSAIFLAGIPSDLQRVHLASGTYQVYATKGPEFSLEKTTITVTAGDKATLDIKTPQRVLDTTGYIASDLHVHSGLSFDNTFAETERVRTFVAEHGEVMVASEHDLPTDYAPYINAMGVAEKVVSIPAVEITSLLPDANNPYTGGHANAFPVQPKPNEFRNGMVAHEGKRMRDVIHALKHGHSHPSTEPVVQLNHPRKDLQLSGKTLPSDWQEIIDNGHYLDHMGRAGHPYNPHTGLHTHPNNTLIEKDPGTGLRDLDFDLIEVVNPGGNHHHDRVVAVRKDWLSFLKQGERIVGTANSDSHTALEQVAVPRTMVAVSNDKVTQFDQSEFIQNLKAGRAYGTTGPMLDVSIYEAKMGDMYSGMRGTLKVTVTKAPWIKVNTLNVQINGETVDVHQLNDQDSQTFRLPLAFKKDSFVTIEVSGPATPEYQTIYPELSPYAFSNPIYVDFDQDGQWSPPGL